MGKGETKNGNRKGKGEKGGSRAGEGETKGGNRKSQSGTGKAKSEMGGRKKKEEIVLIRRNLF